MKRFLLLLIIFASSLAQAQLFNNEWINYSRTYYKFTVAATGLYRINQGTLSSLGMGSIPAEQFQLWRNGQEVPLYTSVQTGPMSGSDYLEFWGEMNDGKPDKVLYRIADFQLCDKWSLHTDTASFFLTVNPSGSNLRLIPTTNNVAGNVLPPEPYFLHTTGTYLREKINQGYAAIVGEYVYSSAYDQGEGWTSFEIGTAVTRSFSHTNLNAYSGPGAPQPRLKINATGNALNPRTFRVKINGDSVLGQTMDYFDYVKADVPFNLSDLTGGTANVDITNLCPSPFDRFNVACYEIVHPRQFNFGNASNFSFSLPANSNGN